MPQILHSHFEFLNKYIHTYRNKKCNDDLSEAWCAFFQYYQEYCGNAFHIFLGQAEKNAKFKKIIKKTLRNTITHQVCVRTYLHLSKLFFVGTRQDCLGRNKRIIKIRIPFAIK